MTCRLVALIVAFTLASVSAAFADRAPTPSERAEIEQALRRQGFTSWGEIQLDEGPRPRWEVENAVASDGRRYDLELDPSYDVSRRKED